MPISNLHPTFACQLRVDASEPATQVSASAYFALIDWIGDRRGAPVDPNPDGDRLALGPGELLTVACDVDQGGWSVRWTREAPFGSSVAVKLRVGEDGSDVAVLMVESGSRGRRKSVAAPDFVLDLVSRHRCLAPFGHSSHRFTEVATLLGEPEMDPFVHSTLLSPQRACPVVLVSSDDDTGPLISADKLAADLAGLAPVFVLADRDAGFAFTRELGDRRLSVYLGGVRLYLPGLMADPSPYTHLLIPPTRVRALDTSGVSRCVLDRLMERFPSWLEPSSAMSSLIEMAGLSTRAAPEPSPLPAATVLIRGRPEFFDPSRSISNVIGKVAEENRELSARIVTSASEAEEAKAERALFEDEVERLESALCEQREDLALRLDDLENEVAGLRWETARLRSQLSSTGRDRAELAETEPTSVVHAVQIASTWRDQAILYLNSAFETATESPYHSPARALHALRALAEVSTLRRLSVERRTSMGSFSQLFSERGVAYRSHQSTTAKTRWTTEYRIHYLGRTYELDQHLVLGSGGVDTCLRIYFFWAEDRLQSVVTHVGRHKPNTLTG